MKADFLAVTLEASYLWGKLRSIKDEFHVKWKAETERIKKERENRRWTSNSVRGDHHVDGANNAYVTSKFSSDGVKNPSAEGFIYMKDGEGGKSSFTFHKDSTMSRTNEKGGFKPSNWKNK